MTDLTEKFFNEEAIELVKRFSPSTKLEINENGCDGLFLTESNTIIWGKRFGVAGLLHEITHAVLYNKFKITGHDGIFADEFTKIFNIYLKEKFPSYEELQRLESDSLAKKEGEEIVDELEKENANLKELLKECREMSFKIRLALSSGKINDVFTLTYQIETKIDNAIGEKK